MAYLWTLSGTRHVDERGRSLLTRGIAEFFDAATGEPIAAFKDSALTQAFPDFRVVADEDGVFPSVYFDSAADRLFEQSIRKSDGSQFLPLCEFGLPVANLSLSVMENA